MGSIPINHPRMVSKSGEMAEWLKAPAWKADIGKTVGGSNPPLSANTGVLTVEGVANKLNDMW